MKLVVCMIVFAGLLGIGVELAGATERDGVVAYGGVNPDPPPSPPDGPNPPPPPPERTV